MHTILGNDTRSTALRALLRAALVVATSFGLKLTAEQVAAIQLAAEAALTAAKAFYTKGG